MLDDPDQRPLLVSSHQQYEHEQGPTPPWSFAEPQCWCARSVPPRSRHRRTIGLCLTLHVHFLLAFTVHALGMVWTPPELTTRQVDRLTWTLWLVASLTHVAAVLRDPGAVPRDDSAGFTSSWPLCDECLIARPPEAHHCSTCGRCVLRMDHHCT